MQFIDSATEQTTAATDVVLALLAGCCAVLLRRFRQTVSFKVAVWTWTFVLVALAAALGAVAHGFEMEQQTWDLIWQPLNLCLGLAVGLFCVGAFYDSWGHRFARRALPLMIGLGVVFFAATTLIQKGFLVFVIYEALAMIAALVIYIRLALNGRLPGAILMAAGVVVNIIAAVVQATGAVKLTLVWEFDHNGVFHLIQLVGILLLYVGLHVALGALSRTESQTGRADPRQA